jgi:hypothetical protein
MSLDPDKKESSDSAMVVRNGKIEQALSFLHIRPAFEKLKGNFAK